MEALDLPVSAVWIEPLWLAGQILLILLAGYLTQRFVARCLTRLGKRYPFPPQFLMPLRGGLRWLIMGSALIFVLERLGVSAAVAAVAFFAMWSVLSNLLCAILIFTVGPFRLGDVVELVDTTDKPGVKGRVVAINLLYTTLIESAEAGTGGAMVQVPNSLFFQRSVRRWRGSDVLPLSTSEKLSDS
jgi:small-conductance mechanosensitive channel